MKERRRAAIKERASQGPPARVRDPLRSFIEEAKILDSILEGAMDNLRESSSHPGELREALHGFSQARALLPLAVRERLADAGLGPAVFDALVDDPRLLPGRSSTRDQLHLFLEEARVRLGALLQELARQSERAYR